MLHHLIRFAVRQRTTLLLIALTILAIMVIWLVSAKLMDGLEQEVLFISVTQNKWL